MHAKQKNGKPRKRSAQLRWTGRNNPDHQNLMMICHSKTGIHPAVIVIIVKRFFWAMTRLMKRNFDVRIHGLFRLVMTRKKRNQLKHNEQKLYMDKNNRRGYYLKKQKTKELKNVSKNNF